MDFRLLSPLKKYKHAYQICVLSVCLLLNFWTSLPISTKSGVNLNTIRGNHNVVIINFPEPEVTKNMADDGNYEVGHDTLFRVEID
jgi:hypothetical protein